jgi:hypothetical protein
VVPIRIADANITRTVNTNTRTIDVSLREKIDLVSIVWEVWLKAFMSDMIPFEKKYIEVRNPKESKPVRWLRIISSMVDLMVANALTGIILYSVPITRS